MGPSGHIQLGRAAESIRKAGAACFRIDSEGLFRLLLVTSSRGQWIIPKGTIEQGQSPEAAALQEAWEEAGVHGWVMGSPVATWQYEHASGESDLVAVLPVWIDELARVWPEDHKRQRRWATLREALELVADPGLQRIITALARRAEAGKLRAA